jgi:hypothetical protein
LTGTQRGLDWNSERNVALPVFKTALLMRRIMSNPFVFFVTAVAVKRDNHALLPQC